MTRRVISLKSEATQIGGGGWFDLWQFATATNTKTEISARCSGNLLAAKCLTIFVEPGSGCEQRESTDLASLAENIKRSTGLVLVHFLAVDRPLTYLPFPKEVDLRVNWQFEIPGGVVESGESPTRTSQREALEEGRLKEGGRVLQIATLIGLPFSTCSGAYAEMTSYHVALVEGLPNPVASEGIHPEHCEMVPLNKAVDFLLDAQKDGILIEGHAITSLLLLERAMRQ